MFAKKIVFLSVSILFTFSMYARDIAGRVYSEKDSSEIIGAYCGLYAAEKQIANAVSDVNGAFNIKTTNNSEAKLVVSFTGYSSAEVLLPTGNGNVRDLKIYLSESALLDEVTVTAKGTTNRHGNMMVYPSASEVKSSPTVIDLFQKMPFPGLQSDPISRALSVDGGQPMILIDDVPASMNEVNALQPKDIARIDYVRVTPARYVDKGYKGLLKIVLKKKNDGGNVYVWGRGCPTTAFTDFNFSGSYHQGPSRFTLMYNNQWRNYQKVYDYTDMSFVGNDFRVDLKEFDRDPFNYFTNIFNFKYDYKPNDKTLFTVKFNEVINPNHHRTIKNTDDSYVGNYDSYSDSRSNMNTPSLDLFFSRNFNKRNVLELQVVGTLGSEDYDRSNTYYIDPSSPQDYTVNTHSKRRSLISEVAYRHIFSEQTTLSAGVQNTLSHSKNKYIGTDYTPVLTENNNYAYVSLSQSVGKFDFSLSTGAKLFWMKNNDNNRHYTRNLSSVTAVWNVSDKWNLQAAFRYSPSIPSLSALTDYPQQTSPYLIVNGNPDLKVTENFSYRLMASYSHKKISTTVSLIYENANKPRTDEVSYLGDELFLEQTINYDKKNHAGATVQFKASGFYGFGANVRMDVDYYHTVGKTWNKELTTFYAYCSLWWGHGPFSISYWRKIPCYYLAGPYKRKEENGDGLSFTYSPNDHWNLTAGWWYMFEKKGTKYPTWSYSETNPYYINRYIENNGNMVVLSVSYSADFGSIFKTGRRTLNNSDNSSSILKL